MAAPAAVAASHHPGFGFALTEEQEAVRAMVRDFARSEIAPHVKEWDEAQTFPRDVMAKLGELGMLGVLVPEEWGGAGLSYVDYIHVVDELSRVDGSIGLSVAAHNSLGTNHIWLFGNDAQKRKWVTPLAQGKLLAAWGLTEAEAGSDSGGTKTTAVLDGDTWVLNGSKNFITHGSVGDVAVLMAVTDKSAGTPRDLRVRRGPPPEGNPRGQEGEQARDARLRHVDARHGGLPDPAGKPARRAGGGLRPGDESPRRRAHLDRGALARNRRGRLRRARARTRSRGSSSARRSPSSRRSRTTSPTWRPRSTRRAS